MTKYAKVGPPFNFLGHLSLEQKTAFYSWLEARKDNFTGIKEFHQIRAQQLRKTAGLLESFYTSESLKPSFEKASWQPGDAGYFPYAQRDDQQPAVLVQRIKERYKEQLQHHDEAVFQMNWLRNHIERQEDQAQYAYEAVATVTTLKSQLDGMFDSGDYDAVLVKDTTKFRVHQLDEPTKWEKDKASYATVDSSGAVVSPGSTSIKMPDATGV